MLFGLGLATFGPLLFVVTAWALKRWLVAPALAHRAPERSAAEVNAAAWRICLLAMLLLALGSWLPGRFEYAHYAEVHCTPAIAERVTVGGFYHTTMYPYEAERYLGEGGFAWVEAPDMYRSGKYYRYAKDASGKTVQSELAEPTARYAVSSETSTPGNSITVTEKRVFELASGRELARAGSVNYLGGPLSFALGVYGMVHCPEPLSESGRRDFNDYYYLERKVLRGG